MKFPFKSAEQFVARNYRHGLPERVKWELMFAYTVGTLDLLETLK